MSENNDREFCCDYISYKTFDKELLAEANNSATFDKEFLTEDQHHRINESNFRIDYNDITTIDVRFQILFFN